MSDNDFARTGTPLYSQFIHLSRYSRWLEKEKRRETWDETVSRYIDFFGERFPEHVEDLKKTKSYIKQFEVMPSMRALMTAGPALDKDEVAGYNCSYLAIDHPRAFDEILYILTCGTGVGFSVERQFVSKLPEVAEELHPTDSIIRVRDSRIGWAKAFRELISLLYAGHIPQWDLSKVRPAGERLKTFGGRASGPEPLNQLFLFTIEVFKKARGRKLSSIECHDLVCKVAEVVVCGGTRRSALLSLSNPSDDRMRLAKSGQWWIDNPQRALSNNSACYTEKPDFEVFLKEWNSLYESKSGERGFFSRAAAENQARKTGRRELGHLWGINPCCVAPNTIIMTSEGPKEIQDLLGKPFKAVVNGKEYDAPRGSWISGEGEIWTLKTKEGYSLELTPEHRIMTAEGSWKEAKDLLLGERISLADGPEGATTEVESFEFSRIGEVWDAEVSEVHAFSANGIYAHNSEIQLRSGQFCNLTEVVVRAEDTLETLLEKTKIATILGTFQATLTNFRYIRNIWKKNTEEERLLGVSLTGVVDHHILGNPSDENREELASWLAKMKECAVETNKEWSEKLGINQSAAVTCNKPSGCRPGDALVTTDSGILTLEEILGKHPENVSWHPVNELNANNLTEYKKITKSYRNGIAKTLKVKLSYNMELESTPNHQWFVKQRYNRDKLHKYEDVNSFVRTDELQNGDILDVELGVYKSETEAKLVNTEEPTMARHAGEARERLKQPLCMSPDLAWLLGYYWGDGCLSSQKKRFRLIDQNISHLEKAQQILKNVFGLSSNIHRASGDRDAFVLEKGSSHLYSWFEVNGLQKEDMRIPEIIRRSSQESILAFMAGLLDSDGCVSKCDTGSKLNFSTAYDSLARSLQDVGTAVGILLGRSLNTEDVNLQQSKHMWLLSSASIQNSRAFDLLVKHSIKASLVKEWHHNNANKSLILGKVVSVTEGREVPTYDVEVESSHWFYAGSVKSHNTVSQLVNSASGIHPRYSKYYVRTVRADKKDPLAQFMKEKGFPCEDDVMNNANFVFSFPVEAPESRFYANNMGALNQLKLWMMYQDYWCEHKPSCTVYYTDDEFLEVGSFLWNNFDKISGISFLPYSDHVYQQAPYQPITKDEYDEFLKKMPQDINWADLSDFEKEDTTKSSHTLACSGGVCEIVDLTDE